MTPEQVCTLIKSKYKKEWGICFLSVLIIGLITHMYKLTNTLPNWDSLHNIYSDQNTIHLGRCFLTIACGISSYYDLPWLNGFLSLAYLGITAILVSEIFALKKPLVLVLTGGLLVSFPTVTSTFSYMYTADGYFLGMLCMTLAIFLTLRYRRGWLMGIPLLGFGYGCYQAYITWAILLILFWSLSQLLYTAISVSSLLQKWVQFALCGLLGTALYGICNQLLLRLQHVSLASYQGVDQMGLTDLHPLSAMKQCIIDFAYFFLGPLDQMNLYSYLNMIILVLLIAFILVQIWRSKMYLQPGRFFLFIVIACAVPFAAFAIYFISLSTNYHMLMMMSLCLIYIFFLMLYEKESYACKYAIGKWTVILLTTLTIYNFTLIANICYQTMQSSYDRSYAVVLRLADRISQIPEARECTKLAVIGQLPDSSAISLNLPPDMTGFIDGYIMSTPLHYQSMLSHDHHMDYALATDEELAFLESLQLSSQMPLWPQEGCITVVNDILVVHMGDEILH